MKRLFDVVFALAVLIVFLPVGLVLVAILRFTGEGEIFYPQPRIGQGRRKFDLFKFATMLKESPSLGTGDITVKNDPRVLPLGKFLRKTKLNEIPQVLNVLVGDMSVVGPRPLTPANFDFYDEETQGIIGKMPPGLTGIGSIVFRDEESLYEQYDMDHNECYRTVISPYKGALEAWYYERRSLLMDLKIILVTAWVVLFPGSRLFVKIFPDLPQSDVLDKILAIQGAE